MAEILEKALNPSANLPPKCFQCSITYITVERALGKKRRLQAVTGKKKVRAVTEKLDPEISLLLKSGLGPLTSLISHDIPQAPEPSFVLEKL